MLKVKQGSELGEDDDDQQLELESTTHSMGAGRYISKDKESASPKQAIANLRRENWEEEEDISKAEKQQKAHMTKNELEDSERNPPPKPEEDEKEGQEEVFRPWWENGLDSNKSSGNAKWTTLEHNGVYFPPPYEPLPPDVRMKYNGEPVDLPPESEEVAGFYAALLETDHARDATFNKNFFEDWKTTMQMHPPRDGTKILKFELCDFRLMYEHFETEKAKKRMMTAEEKKAAKKAKEELEAKYTTCLLDGREEKVGNFRVEPPGLFRGRGDHPKKGALKFRVRPEDITLNIGQGVPLPVPNMPGTWKAIIHDNEVAWLAHWTENVNGNHKYVFLSATSSLKSQSDMQKFEKARELKNYVDRIRQNYNIDLKSEVMADRQRATAMYFIDKLALRAGNERGEDEVDTVGCCSLRCEHVTLEAPYFIVFDFIGTDSIRYFNKVNVEPQIFENVRIFKEGKNSNDNLLDSEHVTTSSLNKHLTNEMKGLTAKVFRTFNASIIFQHLLDEEDLTNATVQEKVNLYNKAIRQAAILCNHQRTLPRTHYQLTEKVRYEHRSLKYERMKSRHALFKIDPKYKENGKYKADESDIDDEWIAEHEENLKAQANERVERDFLKDNEKLQEEGGKRQKDSVLKEYDTAKATLKRERPEEIEETIDELTEKIEAFKLQIVNRDEGKEVELGTMTIKTNYLDPRITFAWCQIHDLPVEKVFPKFLVTKFSWATKVEKDWKF